MEDKHYITEAELIELSQAAGILKVTTVSTLSDIYKKMGTEALKIIEDFLKNHCNEIL